jgi:PIN domain nuclease of toxin-antitoxin system
MAIAAAGLTNLHPDPADRLIVATRMTASAILATADDRILRWPGQLRRHDARR